MATVPDSAGSAVIREAEQLLYFSLPGQIVLLFIAGWIFLNGTLNLSAGVVAAAIVSSVPLGYLIYQAYTSNALWIYQTCWRGRADEAAIRRIVGLLETGETGKSSIDPKTRFRTAKRILTDIQNSSPEGAYIWRLIAIINSRGACLFATIVAAFLPPMLSIASYFSSRLQNIVGSVSPADVVLFYASLFVTIVVLYRPIHRIKNQIAVLSEILVIRKKDSIEKTAKDFAKEAHVKTDGQAAEKQPTSTDTTWKTIGKRYRPLFEAVILLAGVVVTHGLEITPIGFVYILAVGVPVIVVVGLLRVFGKRRMVKRIGEASGRLLAWTLNLGADFSIGSGFGILLAAGLGNWGGWVLFAVFFSLALEMLWMDEVFKAVH